MESEGERAIERMHAPIARLVVKFEHLVEEALRQISVECFEHNGLAKRSLAQLDSLVRSFRLK